MAKLVALGRDLENLLSEMTQPLTIRAEDFGTSAQGNLAVTGTPPWQGRSKLQKKQKWSKVPLELIIEVPKAVTAEETDDYDELMWAPKRAALMPPVLNSGRGASKEVVRADDGIPITSRKATATMTPAERVLASLANERIRIGAPSLAYRPSNNLTNQKSGMKHAHAWGNKTVPTKAPLLIPHVDLVNEQKHATSTAACRKRANSRKAYDFTLEGQRLTESLDIPTPTWGVRIPSQIPQEELESPPDDHEFENLADIQKVFPTLVRKNNAFRIILAPAAAKPYSRREYNTSKTFLPRKMVQPISQSKTAEPVEHSTADLSQDTSAETLNLQSQLVARDIIETLVSAVFSAEEQGSEAAATPAPITPVVQPEEKRVSITKPEDFPEAPKVSQIAERRIDMAVLENFIPDGVVEDASELVPPVVVTLPLTEVLSSEVEKEIADFDREAVLVQHKKKSPKAETPEKEKKPKKKWTPGASKDAAENLAAAHDPLVIQAKVEKKAAHVAKFVESATKPVDKPFSATAAKNAVPDPNCESGLPPPKPEKQPKKLTKLALLMPVISAEELKRVPKKVWATLPDQIPYQRNVARKVNRQATIRKIERLTIIREWLDANPIRHKEKVIVPETAPSFVAGEVESKVSVFANPLPNRGNGWRKEDFVLAPGMEGVYVPYIVPSYRPSFTWALAPKSPYREEPKIVKVHQVQDPTGSKASKAKEQGKNGSKPPSKHFKEVQESIFRCAKGSVLVHCIGADATFGKGIAVEVNKKTKAKAKLVDFKTEDAVNQKGETVKVLKVGKCYLTQYARGFVANLVTKPWSGKVPSADLTPLKSALRDLHSAISGYTRKPELAFCKLECGENRRDWDVVKPLIESVFDPNVWKGIVWLGPPPKVSEVKETPLPETPKVSEKKPEEKPKAAPKPAPKKIHDPEKVRQAQPQEGSIHLEPTKPVKAAEAPVPAPRKRMEPTPPVPAPRNKAPEQPQAKEAELLAIVTAQAEIIRTQVQAIERLEAQVAKLLDALATQ